MIFPDLTLSQQERKIQEHVGSTLVSSLRRLFNERYSLDPQIKISGSTQKGTALPERYFGTDYDCSVLADEELLSAIAYRSNLFEGCQLFSLDFLAHFIDYFDETYFAGHRLSGRIMGRKFDFSIADQEKDGWKWDYNSSPILQYSPDQLDEVKKLKYFLKLFNVSGSEVYGMVGPAAELAIHYHKSFDRVLEIIKHFPRLYEDFSNLFSTRSFPPDFYLLFPPSDDYVSNGLVGSFRFTTPNTFNRLVEAANAKTLDLDEYVQLHRPAFTYHHQFSLDNPRLVSYFLQSLLRGGDYFHVDLLDNASQIVFLASSDALGQKKLDDLCGTIDALNVSGELNWDNLPTSIRDDIYLKCGQKDTTKYVFFVGSPEFPIDRQRIYVPFDFLVRDDASDLIRVMEEGQNETS
ncbi:MAG: hypothetical protein ABIE94_06055 [archaeon]